MLDRIDILSRPFGACVATVCLALSMLIVAPGAGWPQAGPPASLGVLSPAQQPLPEQPAPQQIEPAPPAPAPSGENPGLINEMGKLFEKSLSILPKMKTPGETIDDLNARAKDAGEGLSNMAKPSLMVTGRDRLVPDSGKNGDGQIAAGRNFAVRFHIHPDVRVSPLDGGGILLKLPSGEGWRFRAGGGVLTVEESVYLGGPMVRRAEQLVVSGTMTNSPAEIAWVFEQIVA